MQNVNQKCEYEYEYRERASEWVSECSFFCCCFFCLLFFLFSFFYLMRFCDDVCSMRRWISNCSAGNAGRSTDADGARADCTQREKERKETRRKGEREILRQQKQRTTKLLLLLLCAAVLTSCSSSASPALSRSRSRSRYPCHFVALFAPLLPLPSLFCCGPSPMRLTKAHEKRFSYEIHTHAHTHTNTGTLTHIRSLLRELKFANVANEGQRWLKKC